MTDVVQQRGGGRDEPVPGVDGVVAREAREDAARDVHDADRVTEAAVVGSGVRVDGEPELPHATQPLHLGAVDEVDEQPSLALVPLEGDDVVDRVAVDLRPHHTTR